ncbi:MAG: hypothetical protein GY941_14270 [Planctomycetes bacterium]|nr:hypothetical protein [Planctomycetota bacterium]
MKISSVSNGELTIQANVNKDGDYHAAMEVALKMERDSGGEFVVTSLCEREQWIQICGAWFPKQAEELRDAYTTAKKEIKQ